MKLIDAVSDPNVLGSTTINQYQLEEFYWGKFIATAKQSINDPVDFRLSEQVSLPLTKKSVRFLYDEIQTDSNISYGSLKTDIFYPVGQTVNINGNVLKILSYGDIYIENGINTINITTQLLSGSVLYPLQDVSKENIVMEKMTSIIRLNNEIKNMLSGFRYNWLDYTEEYVSKYDQVISIGKILDFKEVDDNELRYRLSDMKSIIDNGGSSYELTNKIQEILNRFNGELINIKYDGIVNIFNMVSLVKWIIGDLTIDFTKLILQGTNETDIDNIDTIISEVREGTSREFTFTTVAGATNYKIIINNVLSFIVNGSYVQYAIDSFNFYKVDKTTLTETEVIIDGNTNFDKLINAFSLIRGLK